MRTVAFSFRYTLHPLFLSFFGLTHLQLDYAKKPAICQHYEIVHFIRVCITPTY